MAMDDQALPAHSIQEAFLYVLITPCNVCNQMRVRPDSPQAVGPPGDASSASLWIITGLCENCLSAHRYRFELATGYNGEPTNQSNDPLAQDAPINPTEDRSAIIDLVQWVSLNAHLSEAATRTPDRQESRWNLIRAGECLDEALRFFDGDEQPIDHAAFTPTTQQILAAHPTRYERSQLLARRQKHPPRS